MSRKRDAGKSRRMRPAILVACEGETEEVYVDFLRKQYRCPIKIVSRILGGDINERRIKSIQDSMKVSGNDVIQTFFMFDRDVSAVNSKIDKLDGIKLCSNPCIELWFLLHVKNQRSPLSSQECLNVLRQQGSAWKDYDKSFLSLKQRENLWEMRFMAVDRAKTLNASLNPSSTVYKLIEYLEDNHR